MNANDNRATRRRRLCATLLDFTVIVAVAFILLWPLGLFEHERAYEGLQFQMRLFALLVGSNLLVNGWLLLKHGQTLGKRVLGIQIVSSTNGELLPLWQLLIRASPPFLLVAMPFISVAVVVVIDGLWIFTAQRRCLHDVLVGSTVHRTVASGS